jgi:hypothetical protein
MWPPDRIAISKECPICSCALAYPLWNRELNRLQLKCCACTNYWLEPPAFNNDKGPEMPPSIGSEIEGPTDGMVQS